MPFSCCKSNANAVSAPTHIRPVSEMGSPTHETQREMSLPMTGTADPQVDHLSSSIANLAVKRDNKAAKKAKGASAKMPWMHTLHAPSSYKEPEKEPLKVLASLQLEHVYGFRSHYARHQLHYVLQQQSIVYPTAGLGVVQSLGENKSQKYFTAHTDDVVALTVYRHESGQVLAATGQLAEHPIVHVWDVSQPDKAPLATLKLGHERGVASIAFGNKGEYVIAVGQDTDHTIHLFEWKSGKELTQVKGHSGTVLDVATHPTDANQFVAVGHQHIRFWKYEAGAAVPLTNKQATFGSTDKLQNFVSVVYSLDGNSVATGGHEGDLFFWNSSSHALLKEHLKIHPGGVLALAAHTDGFVSGGADGRLVFWNKDHESTRTFVIPGSLYPLHVISGQTAPASRAVRAVDWQGQTVVAALDDSSIVSVEGDKVSILSNGHNMAKDAEIWGLAIHPKDVQVFATASDDGTIRVWNIQKKAQVSSFLIGTPLRTIDYSPCGGFIAAGSLKGELIAVSTENGAAVAHVKLPSPEEVSDVKFSPNGLLLAVASHSTHIYIYDVEKGYKHTETLKGHSSYLTHIDWSADNTYLRSNSGDNELLYWNVKEAKQHTAGNELRDVQWHTATCTQTWDKLGVWQAGFDGTDVNAADTRSDLKVVVSGDDFGKVRLFNYPAEQAISEPYSGHSSHVTNVRFTKNNEYVISVGGMDGTVAQWKFK